MSEPASSPVPAPAAASTRHPWHGAVGAVLCVVTAAVLGVCASWLAEITEGVGYEGGAICRVMVHIPPWAYVLFGLVAGGLWFHANVAPRYERSRRPARVVLSLCLGVVYALPLVVFLRALWKMFVGS